MSHPHPPPKPSNDKRTLTRRFEIAVTCKKTKTYADGDPNRPWYRFQLALIPKHLAHLVDRVQLKLDPSYEVDTRTVRDPFVFSEKAWGQYPIQITVFPKAEFNHPPIHVPHLDLVLTKSRYTEARVLAFRNLPDDIKKKYFSSTGPPSSESSSLGQPPSNNSSSSDLSTTASTPIESTSPRHLSPPPVPAGSTTGQPKNGRKAVTGAGSGGRERKVSSTSAASRPPVSAAASRAPVSQSAGRAKPASLAANRPPAPSKRKAVDPSLPTPSSPERPTKRMKPAVAPPSAATGGGGVAAMLGLASHPPAAAKRSAAATGTAAARKPPTSSSVSSILPTHKIPDDRIPRITNPHSAAHALVRSPPPTSFNLPSRPMLPSSPPPPMLLPASAVKPADTAPTTARHTTNGITVRRVEGHQPPAPSGPAYSGSKAVLRSPPPAAPTLPATGGNVPLSSTSSGATHATPSRAASNPSLQLPAKPTIAPPPPLSSSSSSSSLTSTPVLGNPKLMHPPLPHHHSTPTRPASAASLNAALSMSSSPQMPMVLPKPDPDQREKLKDVLARISPATCLELVKYLYARKCAVSASTDKAGASENVAVYDKVGNALVLDVWRVPADVVRDLWVFVREQGLAGV